MNSNFRVNFANLSIKFGDKDLLDYIDVVSKAFLMDTNIRNTRSGNYFFLDAKIMRSDPKDPMTTVIAGHFVKNTTLTREQLFKDDELVTDHAQIQTSPSAYFVLFLADHRLAYAPETKSAPTLKNFEAAVSLFVKRSFKMFEDEIYYQKKSIDAKYTRSSFYKEHDAPIISVVPQTSRQDIDAFINRFQVINKITVHVVKRNQDIDGENIFEQLLEQTEPLGPTSAKYEVRGGKEGLNIEESKEFVADTTEGGYEDVSIQGKDASGATLNGTNDTFKLAVKADLPPSPEARVNKLSEIYKKQKDLGNIKVGERNIGKVMPKLESLWNDANPAE